MISRLRAAWLIPLLLGISLTWPAFAYAATPQPVEDLTTSPISLNLHIAPGTSQTHTIEVMDNSAQPVTINMQLNEFRAQGTSGLAQIIPATAPESTWVSFSPSSFVAQPGVWSKVQMTIALPFNAQLGYYYVPVFTPVQDIKTQGVGAIFKGSNGILVLVDTSTANESRSISISSFSVGKHVYEYLPVNFSVKLLNSGNIYIPAFGDIYISRNSAFTNSIATLSVNSTQGNILPSSARVFNESWADGFPVFKTVIKNGQAETNKKGQPIYRLDWNLSNISKFRFGKYYAKLLLVYNNGDHQVPLQAVVSFWIIPWKLISIFLLIIIVICLGLWTLYRYSAAAVKQSRKSLKNTDKK